MYRGFTPIGSYFNKFVLRDFEQEDKKLEVHKLNMVQQRRMLPKLHLINKILNESHAQWSLQIFFTTSFYLEFFAKLNNFSVIWWWWSVFIGGRENPNISKYLGRDHLSSASTLTKFLTHSAWYEQVQTNADCCWEISWYEIDVLTTWSQRFH
jgi:hypothetical protein